MSYNWLLRTKSGQQFVSVQTHDCQSAEMLSRTLTRIEEEKMLQDLVIARHDDSRCVLRKDKLTDFNEVREAFHSVWTSVVAEHAAAMVAAAEAAQAAAAERAAAAAEAEAAAARAKEEQRRRAAQAQRILAAAVVKVPPLWVPWDEEDDDDDDEEEEGHGGGAPTRSEEGSDGSSVRGSDEDEEQEEDTEGDTHAYTAQRDPATGVWVTEKAGHYYARLRWEPSSVGRTIGRHGSVIKWLQEETGCDIDVNLEPGTLVVKALTQEAAAYGARFMRSWRRHILEPAWEGYALFTRAIPVPPGATCAPLVRLDGKLKHHLQHTFGVRLLLDTRLITVEVTGDDEEAVQRASDLVVEALEREAKPRVQLPPRPRVKKATATKKRAAAGGACGR